MNTIHMISIIVFAKSAARALLTAVVSTATIVLTILASTFSPVNAQSYGRIGDLVSFADGSKGVLIHVERDGKSGWAIALQDANNAAALEWAPGKENATQALNKTLKQENPAYRTLDDLLPLLQDTAGYATTKAIRSAAGGKKEAFPAAFAVDFDNGWYLPSAGQMFSAFAVEPFVKKTLEENGGKALDGMYWTSTPHSEKAAWYVDKLLGVFDYPDDEGLKVHQYHVRAMRLWKASTSTYTIAFDGNGATSGTMGNVLVEVGKTTTLPPNAYARAGYVFLGWSERKDASVATYIDRQPNVDLAGAKDETKTLYAIWGKNKETAVESALLAKMQCLTNPFEALLTLTGVDAATKVEVYNILGILVYATDLQSTERIDIPSSAWEHGTYLVRVIAPDGVRVLRTVKM